MERLFRWKGKEPIGGSKEKDKTLATTEGSSLSHKSQDRETPNAVTGKERKIYGLKVLHQPSDYTKAIVEYGGCSYYMIPHSPSTFTNYSLVSFLSMASQAVPTTLGLIMSLGSIGLLIF